MTRFHSGTGNGSMCVSPVRPSLPLTDRQRDVLEYVRLFMRQRGFPPTVRDAAAEFGIQTNAIVGHLKALQAKRYIERDFAIARGIRIVPIERYEFTDGAGI